MSENFNPLNSGFIISWFINLPMSSFLSGASATILSFISSKGNTVCNFFLDNVGSFPYSDTATIAVILFVYLFIPVSTVFSPAPPPITTTLGPFSYIVLSKINEFTFTFFLFFILSSVASINNSIFLLFNIISPITIQTNPIANITTTFPASENCISFCTSISDIP